MNKHFLSVLILLLVCTTAIAAKKYKITYSDGRTEVVELEEVQPEPEPEPEPQPEPEPEPEPDTFPPDPGVVQVTATHVSTHHDKIPRFAIGTDVVAVKSGKWSDRSTWLVPPSPGSKVQIPKDITVTYDVTGKFQAVEVEGRLDLVNNTSMTVNELMVLPKGILTAKGKVEIIFPDGPLYPDDSIQISKGLFVFGVIQFEGNPLNKTYVRLASDAKAGDTTITLQEEVNWPVGAEIVLPDTRQTSPFGNPRYYKYTPQWEVKKIASVEGVVIKLDTPLQFAHVGPRNLDGSMLTDFNNKLVKPHVGCLSRSIVVRSENFAGVRGHTMFLSTAHVSVKNTQFLSLGRTRTGPLGPNNQMGRYSVHVHHLVGRQGTGPQFLFQDNSIVDSLKWGMALHGSHYGRVAGNVFYDSDGAAFATEDGSETGNVIENNFVCRVDGQPGYPPLFNGLGEATEELGDQGDAFWFPGPLNIVRNNVAANVYRSAYTFWPDNVPTSPHSRYVRPVQSPTSPLGPKQTVNLTQVALKDFEGNEAYGATTSAIQIWTIGDRRVFPGPDINTVKNTLVWHVTGIGIRFYYADSYLVDGWIQRSDPAMIGKSSVEGGPEYPSRGEPVTHAGSVARKSILRNATIEGSDFGYIQRGHSFTEDVLVENVTFNTAWGIEILPWANKRSVSTYKDILFLDNYSPGSLRAIRMFWEPVGNNGPEIHQVINYQRIEGLNLQLYYYQQAPGRPIVKGGVAPTHLDGDTGLTATNRGKALGILGLVFITAKPTQPMMFCNVLPENGRPILYYTSTVPVNEVTVTIGTQSIKVSGTTGSVDLSNLPPGKHTVRVSAGNSQTTKEVTLPCRTM